jgi:hypothetical protein
MRPGLQETGGPENPQHKAVHHPSCLLEYLSWALESRNLWLAKGDAKRARGYERLVELRARLVLQRGIDPGDALNAITARKGELGVITLDKDWQRLPDYVATKNHPLNHTATFPPHSYAKAKQPTASPSPTQLNL